VPAYFDFDSIYLSNGYLQLNKVNVRANKFIESYEVTIYGTLSSFGRDINRDYLTNLTSLQKYNHTASYDNISASWNGNLFNGDIVYPLADYGTGYQYAAGDFQTFGMNDVDGALTVQNFKPAIRAKAVLDAIFEEAGYTYSSSFINQGFIDDIYMVCNHSLKYPEFQGVDMETYGKIKVGAISGSGMTDVVLTSGSWNTLPWYNTLSDPQGFYQNGAYTVQKETNLEGILNTPPLPIVTLDPDNTTKSYIQITQVNQAADGRIMDIPSNMPYGTNGIKQIDFITGLQKKFNLVIYPNKTKQNEFIIETFNNWYKTGQVKDFNRYINLDERIEVIPANNLAVNELNFGDTLDQDYISQQFSKEANREYAKTYYTDTQNFFSQGKFEVKTTFASDPLIRIAGTGLSGSVAGLTPPVTSYTYVIGNAGWGSDYAACSNTYYYPTMVYAAESNPILVSQLFLDSNLTIPFDGGYSYWKWGFPYYYSKYSSFIDFNGNVNSFYNCP